MKLFGLRIIAYRTCTGAAWLFGATAAGVGTLDKVDTTKIPLPFSGFSPAILAIQHQDWYLIPALGAVAAGFVLIKQMMGEPWAWRVLHDFMDTFRESLFSNERGPVDEHRVTLFRHFPWWRYPCLLKRPFAPRLLPVERSGHISQRSKAAFLAPDEGSKTEGVAGQTWRAQRVISVMDLPALEKGSPANLVNDYARRTWVSPRWVREKLENNKVLARSLCGIPVLVKGKPWGVIVIDSRNPNSLEQTSEQLYNVMGETLGTLLERL